MASYKTPIARRGLTALLLTAVLGLVACSRDIPVPPARADAAEAQRRQQAFVDALKPRRSGKPVVAVLAFNGGTETTDFLLSHAVLQRSGLFDVQAVAPRRGRVALYPALQVEVPRDLAGFDDAHPGGADYVIVPALDDTDDPAIAAWLQQQAKKGARIVGVCAGGLILGRAGLLDGRRFVTHWYYRKDILERHPGAQYVPHQRYVVDRGIATTTGITASVPTLLALVEAVGGGPAARQLADELGVTAWTPAHDSGAFGLGAARAVGYLAAKASFWRHQRWQVQAQDGMDDIALAFAADSWSRTSHVTVTASGAGPVRLRSGLLLLTQAADASQARLLLAEGVKPVQQLDRTLCEIAERFGVARAEWVRMELEYPGLPACAGVAPSAPINPANRSPG